MTLQVFARIDGIAGDSEQVGFVGAVEVLSYAWGITVAHTPAGSIGDGVGTPRPQVQDLLLTARSSSASPQLFLACATGRQLRDVRLDVARAGGGGLQVVAAFRLEEVRIVGFATSGSDGADAGVDTVTFDFRRLTSSYARQRPDGSLDEAVVTGFDFARLQAL
jgi:type VI secretion system secreted protein Hcp